MVTISPTLYIVTTTEQQRQHKESQDKKNSPMRACGQNFLVAKISGYTVHTTLCSHTHWYAKVTMEFNNKQGVWP